MLTMGEDKEKGINLLKGGLKDDSHFKTGYWKIKRV